MPFVERAVLPADVDHACARTSGSRPGSSTAPRARGRARTSARLRRTSTCGSRSACNRCASPRRPFCAVRRPRRASGLVNREQAVERSVSSAVRETSVSTETPARPRASKACFGVDGGLVGERRILERGRGRAPRPRSRRGRACPRRPSDRRGGCAARRRSTAGSFHASSANAPIIGVVTAVRLGFLLAERGGIAASSMRARVAAHGRSGRATPRRGRARGPQHIASPAGTDAMRAAIDAPAATDTEWRQNSGGMSSGCSANIPAGGADRERTQHRRAQRHDRTLDAADLARQPEVRRVRELQDPRVQRRVGLEGRRDVVHARVGIVEDRRGRASRPTAASAIVEVVRGRRSSARVPARVEGSLSQSERWEAGLRAGCQAGRSAGPSPARARPARAGSGSRRGSPRACRTGPPRRGGCRAARPAGARRSAASARARR